MAIIDTASSRLAKVIADMRGSPDAQTRESADKLSAALAKFDSDVADFHGRINKMIDEVLEPRRKAQDASSIPFPRRKRV